MLGNDVQSKNVERENTNRQRQLYGNILKQSLLVTQQKQYKGDALFSARKESA